MNKIEFASIMTREQLDNYYKKIIARTNRQKSDSKIHLEQNRERIFSEYETYENALKTKYYEQVKEWGQKKDEWKSKKCSGCQSPLRLVNGPYGQFWGCPNYRNEGQHDNYPIDFEARHSERWQYLHVRVEPHWCTTLIKNLNLSGKITASDLLEFLLENGYEDLREKYNYGSTTQSISSFITAKKKSSAEEKVINDYISAIFPKASHQLAISYKLEGQLETIAIIDIVAADDKNIYIIEIKRGVIDIVPHQLALYHYLLNHILMKEKDNRNCTSLFVISNRNEADRFFDQTVPYIFFDEFKKLHELKHVKKLFDEKSA